MTAKYAKIDMVDGLDADCQQLHLLKVSDFFFFFSTILPWTISTLKSTKKSKNMF